MKKSNKKIISLITSIIIPSIIMIACISVVGISYAWFSTSAVTTVSTITLSTEECFVLTFDFGDNPEDQYNGQTAFKVQQAHEHLCTSEFATDVLGYANGTVDYNMFMADEPYKVGTGIRLDTMGKEVEFEVKISSVRATMTIEQEGEDDIITTLLDLSNVNLGPGEVDLIPYAFTWYIEDTVGDNVIYTPYRGTKTYGGQTTTDNTLPITNESVKWSSTPTKSSIDGFTATLEGNSTNYNLYIVFCPEQLYWMQYSALDWRKDLNQIYTAQEINYIKYLTHYQNIDNPPDPGTTYSDSLFTGASFEFSVVVNVLNVAEG